MHNSSLIQLLDRLMRTCRCCFRALPSPASVHSASLIWLLHFVTGPLGAEIFKCTPSPEPPTLEMGAENDDGCYILAEEDCDSVPGCVWCHSSEAPSACYFEEKAKR